MNWDTILYISVALNIVGLIYFWPTEMRIYKKVDRMMKEFDRMNLLQKKMRDAITEEDEKP